MRGRHLQVAALQLGRRCRKRGRGLHVMGGVGVGVMCMCRHACMHKSLMAVAHDMPSQQIAGLQHPSRADAATTDAEARAEVARDGQHAMIAPHARSHGRRCVHGIGLASQ